MNNDPESEPMTASNIIFTMGVLLFTITIIWGIAWLAMRFQLVPGQIKKRNDNPSSQLMISENLTLDTKRRLVKVEDGEYEHLILLGPTTETHIQSKKIKNIATTKILPDDEEASSEKLIKLSH
jgi:flagellar biogenesis protein FliO